MAVAAWLHLLISSLVSDTVLPRHVQLRAVFIYIPFRFTHGSISVCELVGD